MQVTFDHKTQEASSIWTFYFKPVEAVRYTAGQFIEMTLPHENVDNRGIRRWFTLSSSPSEALLSITTKLADEAGSSFKRALSNLVTGTELKISEPMGDFVLPKFVQSPLLFIAGGIGITPVHSIFSWLAATHEVRPIDFIYGVRNEDEIIFQNVINKAGVTPKIIVSQPSEAWGGERGNITAELILGLESITDETLIYISGPEAMVNSLIKDLKLAGVQKQQIVIDGFPGYGGI